MNTIIHEIIRKITLDMKNNLEDLILESKDISKFILNTSKSLDEIGVKIVKEALEMLDETIRDSSTRKEEYYIQRRNDKKTLITKFGEVNYQRTYYKNKKDGSLSIAFILDHLCLFSDQLVPSIRPASARY
jgi:hypothetical protein